MKEYHSSTQLQAVVIGRPHDSFVVCAMNLLNDFKIENINCLDVYQVVGRLSQGNFSNVLVIGRLEQLNIEDGKFFQLASRIGCNYCCIISSGLVDGKHIADMAVSEMKTFVLDGLNGLQNVISEVLTARTASLSAGANKFKMDDFQTTADELNALLGT